MKLIKLTCNSCGRRFLGLRGDACPHCAGKSERGASVATLDTWWSPAAECYRVEDREMFTYYSREEVVAHFVNRERPAQALVSPDPDSPRTVALIRELQAAGIAVVYSET